MMQMQGGGLPAEYQQVEWLQADGNGSYIDTLILPDETINIDIEVYYGTANARRYEVPFGLKGQSFSMFDNAGNVNADLAFRTELGGGQTALNYLVTRGNWHTIHLSLTDEIVKIDGTVINVKRSYNALTGKLWLFGKEKSGSATTIDIAGYARLKSAIVKYGSTIVGNFIPCIRKSGNEPGMFDTVTKTFFTNAGTGDFIIPT